ncbi:serine carboxypeptidase S28 [Colletotrichum tofieldiae]|nr:serine carboxypeptidase S28 [Colletotrichum tofieldiae]
MWEEFGRESEVEAAVKTSSKTAIFRLFANDTSPGAPDPATLYQAYNLSVPVDHFHNDSFYEPHSNGTFPLRYWYDDRFYKPGGPVIALAAGETNGAGRLPFLQKGIVAILAEATNGVGVILEHRYYGRSYPTRTSARKIYALADTAYLAKHIIFPGKLAELNLTAPGTPWIVYGGSYAGAFVAFLRKVYPDVFWGAISSSGVTAAVVDFWEYYEAARLYSPEGCAETTQKLTHVVDNILLQKGNTTEEDILTLKTAFGLGNITEPVDFASTIRGGIGGLQGRNWDPAIDNRAFLRYCGNMTSDQTIWPATEKLDSTLRYLLEAGGYEAEIEEICRKAFNITTPPDVDAINKYGGYNFSYPRVAIIDGEADPWRAASPNKIGLARPESTTEEPNLVIAGGAVHHWDENGIFKNETTAELPPLPVKEAQDLEVRFVRAWLEEWKETHS